MFCKYCGGQISDGSRFCNLCGGDQSQAAAQGYGGSDPNQTAAQSYGGSDPWQSAAQGYGGSDPNQTAVQSYGGSDPNQTAVQSYGGAPRQPAAQGYGGAPRQPAAQGYGGAPRQPASPGNGFNRSPQNCIFCGSNNVKVEVITETKTQGGQGFSATKGCLGYLLLGPLGILCGTCGSKQSTTVSENKTWWVCSDCGNRFKTVETANAEIKEAERKFKVLIGFAVFFALLILIVPILNSFEPMPSSAEGPITILCIVIGLISAGFVALAIYLKKQADKLKEELKELENHQNRRY